MLSLKTGAQSLQRLGVKRIWTWEWAGHAANFLPLEYGETVRLLIGASGRCQTCGGI